MNNPLDTKNPKQVVEQGYDRVAHAYASLEGETEWPRMRWLKKVLDKLAPSASVLDLGCGSGAPADIEISKEHQVTGVDISQTQIDLALKNIPNGTFLHEDAGSIEFPPSSFDAVVSFYTLEHIPRQEHATILGRIYHWLKPGGLLLISMEAGEFEDVFGKWLGVPMFISCFNPEKMDQLVLKSGFEMVETVIEPQVEQGEPIPYHWILARK